MQGIRRTIFRPRIPQKAGLVAVLAAICDLLFYEQKIGISLALFALLLACGILYSSRLRVGDPAVRAALTLVAAGCIALAENVSWLSGAFATAGLVALAVAYRASWHRNSVRWLAVAAEFARRALFLPLKDARNCRKILKRNRDGAYRMRRASAWVMPLGSSAIFIGLFADANPIIFDWIARISNMELQQPERIALWFASAFLCWPFIRPRIRGPAGIALETKSLSDLVERSKIDSLFSSDAVIRSLIMFNGIFAVQTILDATYLWGGRALPNGLTYAEYAHRGAYPLVAAALLAASFVLIATRPGSDGAQKGFVRVLVYFWVSQTIVLVGASIWRTSLYVSVYSLTYLRVAALVWMTIVAIGLGSIIIRLMWNRTNAWLIGVNLLTALSFLYAICFIDVGGVIARFNVEHSRAASAQGLPLDFGYLERIGPQALPALDRYLAITRAEPHERQQAFFHRIAAARSLRTRLASELTAQHRNWRGYTFRSYRLSLAVAMTPVEIYDGSQSVGEWTIK